MHMFLKQERGPRRYRDHILVISKEVLAPVQNRLVSPGGRGGEGKLSHGAFTDKLIHLHPSCAYLTTMSNFRRR